MALGQPGDARFTVRAPSRVHGVLRPDVHPILKQWVKKWVGAMDRITEIPGTPVIRVEEEISRWRVRGSDQVCLYTRESLVTEGCHRNFQDVRRRVKSLSDWLKAVLPFLGQPQFTSSVNDTESSAPSN